MRQDYAVKFVTITEYIRLKCYHLKEEATRWMESKCQIHFIISPMY